MPRRMFALVGDQGEHVEYASPAEGRDGELYLARLLADPAHVEVDPETRKELKLAAKAKPAEQRAAEKPAAEKGR